MIRFIVIFPVHLNTVKGKEPETALNNMGAYIWDSFRRWTNKNINQLSSLADIQIYL